ncbi:MAG: PLP-dependent transferase, partial [Bacteroidota bacterium]
LEKREEVAQVYYPGLKSHPDYDLAKKQMSGFGGMMSFELQSHINAEDFMKSLKLIKPSMSLAGVESTMLSPTQTSHALLSPEERSHQGIADGLIRFSVGIEEIKDLKRDIKNALKKVVPKEVVV